VSRLRDWSQDKTIEAIARAAAAGHDVNRLVTIPRGTPGTNHGTMAVCSCGWTSSPRGRKVIAASAGLWHAMEVCSVLDERKRLDGVEWSAAPSSPALHNLSIARSGPATRRRSRSAPAASPNPSDPA
jgi:hypothetical protein